MSIVVALVPLSAAEVRFACCWSSLVWSAVVIQTPTDSSAAIADPVSNGAPASMATAAKPVTRTTFDDLLVAKRMSILQCWDAGRRAPKPGALLRRCRLVVDAELPEGVAPGGASGRPGQADIPPGAADVHVVEAAVSGCGREDRGPVDVVVGGLDRVGLAVGRIPGQLDVGDGLSRAQVHHDPLWVAPVTRPASGEVAVRHVRRRHRRRNLCRRRGDRLAERDVRACPSPRRHLEGSGLDAHLALAVVGVDVNL